MNKLITVVIAILIMMASAILFFTVLEYNNVTGAISIADIAPDGFVYVAPDDFSQNNAQIEIAKAEIDIQDMKDLGLITLFASDALVEAKSLYEQEDYGPIFKLTQLIGFIKKEKIEFLDRNKLLEVKKQAAKERGVESLQKVTSMQQQAMSAFTLEQLNDANNYLQQASSELENALNEYNRVKIVTFFSRNFLVQNWWKILIVLVILVVGIPPLVRFSHRKLTRFKLEKLNLELKKIKELIKELQKEVFVKKTITTKIYQDRAAKFEDRITQLKQTIPVLEAQLKKNTRKSWLKIKFGGKKTNKKSTKSKPKKAKRKWIQ
jgi:hypothetical protein